MALRSSFPTLVSLLATVTFASGCSGPEVGAGEPVETTQSALFGANEKTAFDYFVCKGLTAEQSAGIIGNLDQESGMDPTILQYGGGPGRGIAQWSAGGRWDTSSGDNENWFVTNQDGGSGNIWTLNAQLDFIWFELTHIGYGYSSLKQQTTVSGATNVFMSDYEICGTCDASQRTSYAQAAYNAYASGTGCGAEYAATFVMQSFPYASTTMQMTAGQVLKGQYIELKNTGTKTWDSNTKIGTTMPRDRSSAFADSSWLAPNRLAAVSGTVPPGGTYKFTFDLAAPMMPGLYDEHFGVVEEGVAWFSDSGQGGPPDNQLEVKIQVNAAPSSSSASASSAATTSSSGGPASSAASSGAGGATGAGGGGAGGGSVSGTGGATGAGGSGSGGGTASEASSSGGEAVGATGSSSSGKVGSHASPGQSSGCAVQPSGPSGRSEAWLLGLAVAALAVSRRRRS